MTTNPATPEGAPVPYRTYIAELTDPVTQEVLTFEAATEQELDEKIAAALPDTDPVGPAEPAATSATLT